MAAHAGSSVPGHSALVIVGASRVIIENCSAGTRVAIESTVALLGGIAGFSRGETLADLGGCVAHVAVAVLIGCAFITDPSMRNWLLANVFSKGVVQVALWLDEHA